MAIEVKIPALGESISEVVIARWLKKDGDYVQMDEVLCELETDKATMELNAEQAGTLKIMAKEGDTLKIGDIVCAIDPAGVPTQEALTVKAETPVASKPSESNTTHYADKVPSPAAAKILSEKGVDANTITGSGKDGRITKSDAINASNVAPTTPTASNAIQIEQAKIQHREKMTPLRKTIAKRLVAVKNETAMLTTFNEVNMGPLMELRAKYKDRFKEKHEIGLGFMSFFTKAAAMALAEFPAVNAMIDGDELVFNHFVDISIAVSAPKGLMVPVVRNADQLSLAQIEKEIAALAKKARDSKLSLEEMAGGTFTITNGGVFGSMLSTPIINPPQSAVLGMHNIVERPIAVNGQVVIKPIMYVALSYDHRIIDGKESVSFLYRIKELIEDPARMLLQI